MACFESTRRDLALSNALTRRATVCNLAATEAWYFQNLTEDAHPVHVHLVEFQLEDRAGHRRRALQGLLGKPEMGRRCRCIIRRCGANVEDAVDFP